MLQQYTKDPAKAAFAHRASAAEEDDFQKNRILNKYLEVLSYFLVTYTTDSSIAEAAYNITNFRGQNIRSPSGTRKAYVEKIYDVILYLRKHVENHFH